jgi:endogenous inhibitor of DNA gyrase (YacG/DUF329 family)
MGSTARSSACPICGAAAPPRHENRFFPFCTERCQTIDLGQWLDERYRIPSPEAPPDDESS